MKEIRAETVIAESDAVSGKACKGCGAEVHVLEGAVGMFLGSRGTPRCLDCLARLYGREPQELAHSAARQMARLDCYRAGWDHARALLRRAGDWPPVRFPCDLEADSHPPEDRAPASPAATTGTDAIFWDAGDTSCGDLVLELRERLQGLPPGALLRVRSLDPGAVEDIPAWCRVTGHALLSATHPDYLLCRRDERRPGT